MKRTIIAIDGAARKPGTPECFSVGACVVRDANTETMYTSGALFEEESTGQRGEIMALMMALEVCMNSEDDLYYIVSDSEYVVNTINKEWYKNWENKGWITSSGTDVKNKDLWVMVADMMKALEDKDIVVYHIKGHVIPFGKVTASNLMKDDGTLQSLMDEVYKKYDNEFDVRQEAITKACNLFEKNNGAILEPGDAVLRDLIVSNVIVDLLAGAYADAVMSVGTDSFTRN